MNLLKRMWAAFVARLNAPVAEIDGCRNCKHADVSEDDQVGWCLNTEKGRACLMNKSCLIYLGSPVHRQDCDGWEPKEGETK